MNTEEFNKVYADQMKLCSDTLIEKAKEYASDKDRLHNFKKQLVYRIVQFVML